MVIPKTGRNCVDSVFRTILCTLGYQIPPGANQDKVRIAESVLATLYLMISLATFRQVGLSVLFLGLIWGGQISLSLYRARREEQEKSTQFIRCHQLDDTAEVSPPSNRRILLLAVLFAGLLVLLVWNVLMNLSSAEFKPSVTVWDGVCTMIYICAYAEQMVEILIHFYGAEMNLPVIIANTPPNSPGQHP